MSHSLKKGKALIDEMSPNTKTLKPEALFSTDITHCAHFWIRPGVTFWPEDVEGKTKYFLCDYSNLRFGEINETAYETLKLMNGKLCFAEVCQSLSIKFEDNVQKVENYLRSFLKELIENRYVMTTNPRLLQKHQENMLRKYYRRWLEYYPRLGLMYYELTKKCNLRCFFCYNNSGLPRTSELAFHDSISAVNKLIKAKVQVIIFTGGEPLADKHKLVKLSQKASRFGIVCQVFTNGTLIDRETAKELKKAGVRYARVSIHGATSKTYENITGVQGSYERALEGVKNLINEKIKVCWTATMSKRNFNELEDILELALNLGCDGFRAGSMDPLGSGKRYENELLTPEEEMALWIFLDEAIATYGHRIKIGWGADWCMERSWTQQVLKPPIPKNKESKLPSEFMKWYKNSLCGIGVRSAALTAEGYIIPCPVLSDIRLGHILKDDLIDVWMNNEIFHKFRNRSLDDYEFCSECGMRYVCVGGCRASAFSRTGSLTGKDLRRCLAIENLRVKGSYRIKRELTWEVLNFPKV